VSVACISCGADNGDAARFCSECGAILESRCPRCDGSVAAGARFCPACGQPLVTETPAEERKLVTALFIDLVESTKLADHADPERVRSILQDYFTLVSSTVQAWGGTIEKYVGDAVLAVFGVPHVREDDAARAVSAAVEIVDRFEDLSSKVRNRHGVSLAVRLGVNTGEVVAPTEVRSDRPMVTGDPINVAARLQAAAHPGEIVVGQRTHDATALLFRYGDPMELELKGKDRPVRAYGVLARIPGAVEAGPSRTLQARIVGRDRELAVIGGLLDEAIQSRGPRLALVYGPAGIGKSRLVREAIDLGRSERPDLVVLRGRCPAIGQAITFWPFAEIVRAATDVALDDSAAVAEQKLRTRTAQIGSSAGLDGSDIEGVTAALATTAGIDIADNPLDRSRPGSVSTELSRRWPQFLSAMAARQPIVVVVEDIHWASEQVVAMLEHLLIRSSGPLVLIATARPEFAESHPSFAAGRPEVATLALRPLSRVQATGLIDGLLPRDLPSGIRDQVLDTAEGNPLFLEEIVRRLIEEHSLEERDAEWSIAGGSSNVDLPDTINGLLGARIDALPDDERRILREASVVGRVFWEAPVAAAIGGTGIAERLERLERRGLISMRPTSSLGGQVEYLFKHALIRDVAYAGLSLARRARAHSAVGGWLSDLGRERPEELAELVAFHYRAALGDGVDLAWDPGSAEFDEVKRRARAAFLLAGAAARKRFAIDTAVGFHEAAIDASPTDAERAEALEELGDDYDAAYDGDRAVPTWQRAVAMWEASGSRRVAAPAMKIARMGALRWGGFSTPMEPEVIDRFVDLGLSADPDPIVQGWLQIMRAATGLRWVAFHRQDPIPLEDRVHAGEDALAVGDETGDVALQSQAARVVGGLLLAYGDVKRGLALTRERFPVVTQIGDPREQHLVTIVTANTLVWMGGQAAEMVPVLEKALVTGRELRVHDHCHSTGTLINALYMAGRWDEIPGYIDEHLAAFKTDEAGTSCPYALGVFGLGTAVLAHRGDLDRARQIAADTPRNDAPIGLTEALQAVAAIALGEPDRARRIAEEVLASGRRSFAEEPPVELAAMLDALVALEDWDALRTFLPEARRRAPELVLLQPAILRAEGLLAIAAGSHEEAITLLDDAVAGFDAVSVFDAARTREALASVDLARREALLAAAAETYTQLGARPHLERVSAARSGA
jgi:class 3 adenylate cyclase/tetratricopeptide (TPR) repeat protein